jgi:hypothetical protein
LSYVHGHLAGLIVKSIGNDNGLGRCLNLQPEDT